MGEGVVEPAYSPVTVMVPNYTSGSGVPATVDFSDQMLRDPQGRIGLASQVDPPMATTQGLYSHTALHSLLHSPLHSPLHSQPATGSDTVEPTETI